MTRTSLALAVVGGVAAGGLGAYLALRPAARRFPDSPAVLTQLREVSRLESLDVALYKKVSFTPDPPPAADDAWKDVWNWARYRLQNPHGRAILFADAHLGIDLRQLDASRVRIEGDKVTLHLPPTVTQVALRPGETEIIDSNLDSAQTAQLLQSAQEAFLRDVSQDRALQARAQASAERDLRSLLLTMGFREVVFSP
jgi:hypothetical protein